MCPKSSLKLCGLAIGAAALIGMAWAAEDAPKQSALPQWQRLLKGGDARKANELQLRAIALYDAGKFEEALQPAEAAADLRQRLQGKDHWQAVDAHWTVDAIRRVLSQGKSDQDGFAQSFALRKQADALVAKEMYKQALLLDEKVLAVCRKVLGEAHPHTASAYNNLAFNLIVQGRYQEAEEASGKALAICRKVLGEEHPHTAAIYSNVASRLKALGRYREAEEGLTKALAIERSVLGEAHPGTAMSYNNLASNLQAQGRYREAEEGYRKALAILRQRRGEEHSDIATCYNNVATNLHDQGRYREAEEAHAKALAIRRKVLGEGHSETASSYLNLAVNLQAQGRYQEAAEGYARSLAICRNVFGEEHPSTATCYNNVAINLKAQGRVKEAEAIHRQELAICRKGLGEEHAETATSYNNLAFNFNAQRRYAEAAEAHVKALAICREVHGEKHPHTATSYNNIAENLGAQGRYDEAVEVHLKALGILRQTLGEEHSLTAGSYKNVAYNLEALGRHAEAESYYSKAADAFLGARLRLAASGLGRVAKSSESSPLLALAAVLARNGKPIEAWQRFEQGLARGTWDDLSARLRRPAKETARQTELIAQLERLDQLIERASAVKKPTPEQEQERKELLTRRLKAQEELTAFARHLEKTYGPVAGQVFDRAQIQATLPSDTALVGWIDIKPAGPKAADPNGDHWAVLLRSKGEPVWVRLRGNGPDGAWTDNDTTLPNRLRDTLQSPRGEWRALATKLSDQRLKPLAKHLAAANGLPAVRHLVVLAPSSLPGVPVELLAEGYTVSYALSGTFYAHLRKQPKLTTQGLFALADPVYETPKVAEKSKPRPPGGVLLTMVVPGSNAAESGLKPNDVLLRYGDIELTGPADFKPAPESKDPAERIAVTVWRDGNEFPYKVRPGRLGVVVASEPAPKALAEQRRLDRVLASRGDDKWKPLPGTRAEVVGLRQLFGGQPHLLFASDASEQRLEALAKSGELGKYRYVHLATHGQVDDSWALRSAVILSRDKLPDPGKQLDAGLPIYDGRLTADEMLRQWNLNSELVTLSACQTALGKYERGEGFMGFAQALLLCGSRSVCLSMWKVDDTATALLMERFYQNLLGKREGLKTPMPKALALAEAKKWLRELPGAEVVRVAARLNQGVERGTEAPLKPLIKPVEKDERPYAHPYYWAAFVLIGDPD